MSQYDPMFDLKINVGHYDLYFMVQWFCLISWRLFDVWTPYFGIMSLYDPKFELKINVGHCDLYFMVQWFCLISSPEPSGSQGELIVYPCSGVCCRRRRRQQCLNIISSETAWPIKAKLYVEPPWEGGTKVYINGPGHMTKMAAMPIYGKNL